MMISNKYKTLIRGTFGGRLLALAAAICVTMAVMAQTPHDVEEMDATSLTITRSGKHCSIKPAAGLSNNGNTFTLVTSHPVLRLNHNLKGQRVLFDTNHEKYVKVYADRREIRGGFAQDKGQKHNINEGEITYVYLGDLADDSVVFKIGNDPIRLIVKKPHQAKVSDDAASHIEYSTGEESPESASDSKILLFIIVIAIVLLAIIIAAYRMRTRAKSTPSSKRTSATSPSMPISNKNPKSPKMCKDIDSQPHIVQPEPRTNPTSDEQAPEVEVIPLATIATDINLKTVIETKYLRTAIDRPLIITEKSEPFKLGTLLVSNASTAPNDPTVPDVAITKVQANVGDNRRRKSTSDPVFQLRPATAGVDGLTIGDIPPGHIVKFDIYFYPSVAARIFTNTNPDTAKLFDLTVQYTIAGANTQTRELEGIAVKPDLSLPSAYADIYLPDIHHPFGKKVNLLDCSYVKIDQVIDIDPSKADDMVVIPVRIGNAAIAEYGNRSVIVWGIKIHNVKTDLARLTLSPERSLEDALAPRDSQGNKVDEDAVYHLKGNGQELELNINVSSSDFRDIALAESTSILDVRAILEFYLYEDTEGTYIGGRPEKGALHYQREMLMHLRRKPNESWLSIDFGTSAIVARYGDAPVDLRSHKRALYTAAFADETMAEVDEAENLINSVVCFRSATGGTTEDMVPYDAVDDINDRRNGRPDTLNAKNLSKLPILFSPSTNTLDQQYLLPCLKLLVGYNYLPSIFSHNQLKALRYMMPDGSVTDLVNIDADGQASYTDLMKIEVIFTQVYKQLFGYYIRQSAPKEINKLVLSVPNTYSPVQRDWLRRIARKVMPRLYPEYVALVSESDAVAYYYAYNQPYFHRNANLAPDDPRRRTEKVLIYDMGAGTLDLTYFSITHKPDRQTDIEIISKSGIVKAGNYLDYVLAEIFVDLICKKRMLDRESDLPEDGDKQQRRYDALRQMISIDAPVTGGSAPDTQKVTTSIDDRRTLHDYIRNVVKPIIGKGYDSQEIPRLTDDLGNGIKIQYANPTLGNTTLSVGDFTQSKKFKDFVNYVAKTYVENFARDLASFDVDTVIFSGRSSVMVQIRQKVADTISALSKKKVLFADLGNMSLVESVKSDSNITVLKDVVTKGTMAYASIFYMDNSGFNLIQRPMYAKYGIVLTDEHFHHPTWIPLIDPANMPKPKTDGSYEFVATVPINVHQQKITIVETYSASPESIISSHPNRFDEVTMDEFTLIYSTTVGAATDIQLGLIFRPKALSRFELHFNGRRIPLKSVFQDFSSEALHKSLWPVLYTKE